MIVNSRSFSHLSHQKTNIDQPSIFLLRGREKLLGFKFNLVPKLIFLQIKLIGIYCIFPKHRQAADDMKKTANFVIKRFKLNLMLMNIVKLLGFLISRFVESKKNLRNLLWSCGALRPVDNLLQSSFA